MRNIKFLLLILVLLFTENSRGQNLTKEDSIKVVSNIIPNFILSQLYAGNIYNLQEHCKTNKTILFKFIESEMLLNQYELYLKNFDWQIRAYVVNNMYPDEEYTVWKFYIDFTNPADARKFINYFPSILKFQGSNDEYFKGNQTIRKTSETVIEIWRDYPEIKIKPKQK